MTNNYYIASPHGEIYGLDHTAERFDPWNGVDENNAGSADDDHEDNNNDDKDSNYDNDVDIDNKVRPLDGGQTEAADRHPRPVSDGPGRAQLRLHRGALQRSALSSGRY